MTGGAFVKKLGEFLHNFKGLHTGSNHNVSLHTFLQYFKRNINARHTFTLEILYIQNEKLNFFKMLSITQSSALLCTEISDNVVLMNEKKNEIFFHRCLKSSFKLGA